MGEPIGNDAGVAGEAIRYALLTDAFTTAEVRAAAGRDLSRREVVRTLRELVREGWLARDDGDDGWTPGERTRRRRCAELTVSQHHPCDATGTC